MITQVEAMWHIYYCRQRTRYQTTRNSWRLWDAAAV